MNFNTYKWTCFCCGKEFTGLPLDQAFDQPISYHCLTDLERSRAFLNSDFCKIPDQDMHFVRGVIELPIIGFRECFRWGVWLSVSRKNFDLIVSTWQADEPPSEPIFGWLNNRIDGYPDTFNLKTNLHLRADWRPSVELAATNHPLAIEQRGGITLERVQEIAIRALHP